VGQVDYCAASSFQDAFAQSEQQRLARTVLTIDWGAWRETGLAWRAAIGRGERPAEALPHGMSPSEGIEAFRRALGAGLPQVLVSPIDLSARRDPEPVRLAEKAAVPAGSASGGNGDHPAPRLRNETERLIAGIWQEVLGVKDIGADDNFFDLGGDSVISLQFIARAKKAGLKFTNRQVFEQQTVAALAAIAGKEADGVH
jgi:hypothetical protein